MPKCCFEVVSFKFVTKLITYNFARCNLLLNKSEFY